MSEKRGHKRRRIIIKILFQFKLLAVFVLAILSMALHLYFSLDPSLTIIIFVIVVILFILTTHLIAGPLYRFEKSFEILREGDLTYRINLRKGDELRDLAEMFNDMMEDVHNKMKSDRTKREEVVQTIEDMKGMVLSSGLKDDLKQKLSEKLDSIGGRVREINSEFTV